MYNSKIKKNWGIDQDNKIFWNIFFKIKKILNMIILIGLI